MSIKLFYAFVGGTASLAFFLFLYQILLIDSNIMSLIRETSRVPEYLWLYGLMTVAAIILFGESMAFLVYRWRAWGAPRIALLKNGGATGLGTILGAAASACPVCGSTILATLGIASGLAAFPLGGLEIKALSLGFIAMPLLLTAWDIDRMHSVRAKHGGADHECEGGTCPTPRKDVLTEDDTTIARGLAAGFVMLFFVAVSQLSDEPVVYSWLYKNAPWVMSSSSAAVVQQSNGHETASSQNTSSASADAEAIFAEVTPKVVPADGFQSKIALRDSMVRLAQEGVIDSEEFLALYEGRGGLPQELRAALEAPSDAAVRLTSSNAYVYVNLLWGLGLSNYMSTNRESPVNGDSLFNFASTGGWTLGKEENGGSYFNKFPIVALTSEQEALVTDIAKNTYRPCCNNSTFFQDCNHGSALLGLLQLGAAQGLSEQELYREALAFNSFWFSDTYIQTAAYFKAVKGIDWENVDAKLVMGKDYSSASGWAKNVNKEAQRLGLIPKSSGGGGCGV